MNFNALWVLIISCIITNLFIGSYIKRLKKIYPESYFKIIDKKKSYFSSLLDYTHTHSDTPLYIIIISIPIYFILNTTQIIK